MLDLHDILFMSQVKRIQYCCCSFHYVTKKSMSQPTSKQLFLFGQKTLVFSQSFVLVSPQWAILWRCLTCTIMLRVYSACTSSHKHKHLVLVNHLNSTGEGRNVKLHLIYMIYKDISFVFLAQLLAPHIVSLQLMLHNAHAQCAYFIVTHHSMKLGETVREKTRRPQHRSVS